MDFSFSPEQEALRDLARRILSDRLTDARRRAVEADPDWFDREAWAELARAKLLGVALPEEYGGGGLGFVELCLLLEAVGWTVAPLPAVPTLVGALPIAAFGTVAQKRRWLPAVAAGESVLTAALVDSGADDAARPATRAVRDGAGWRLEGSKAFVPFAHLAERILVPARTEAGVAVFLLDPQAPGVGRERLVTTSGEPQCMLGMAGAAVGADDLLGDPDEGGALVTWLAERAVVGLCAVQAGVTARALAMTAEYTSKREQFGKPIATFQAVGQRAADAYIDVEAIRWTMWQAAWRLAEGLPAAEEAAVAKFWGSEAGHRVVYACTHLHGGMGVDLDYPLHRYYLWSKQFELTLGSAERQLLRLGAALREGAAASLPGRG
jgi:alkylation response protein AidB-like acyl-CoA dehydrogenase